MYVDLIKHYNRSVSSWFVTFSVTLRGLRDEKKMFLATSWLCAACYVLRSAVSWVQVSVDSERLGPSVLPPVSNVTQLACHWLAAPCSRLWLAAFLCSVFVSSLTRPWPGQPGLSLHSRTEHWWCRIWPPEGSGVVMTRKHTTFITSSSSSSYAVRL